MQWIPWLLRMSRPGERLTRKTIMMQSKMKQLDLKETSSKSLLANVLDMDDDYRPNPKKNIQISTVNRTFYRYICTLDYQIFGCNFDARLLFSFHYEILNLRILLIKNTSTINFL